MDGVSWSLSYVCFDTCPGLLKNIIGKTELLSGVVPVAGWNFPLNFHEMVKKH